MHDHLDPNTVSSLAAARAEPSVSIYIPVAEKGAEVEQGSIRLKNALTETSERLEQVGVRSTDAANLLAPGQALVTDADFWLYQGQGLGLLIGGEHRVTLRLPHPVPASVTVSDRFHVRPLVPGLGEMAIPVLVVSRGARRFLEVSMYGVDEVVLDAPASLADANWFVDREAQLQSRPSSAGGGYHGHRDAGRADQADLSRYLRAVAESVATSTSGPVMLAATDELRGAYRSACHGVHPLTDIHIAGNRESAPLEDIRREAIERFAASRPSVDARRSEAEAKGLERSELGSVVAVAAQGRVGELLVAVDGPRRWGTFDPDEMEVTITSDPGNRRIDLVDLAIELTLRHGGNVQSAEVDTAVALLRY